METFIQQRGRYFVNCYTINITQVMKSQALAFAKNIILSDNQYSRLLPDEIKECNNVNMQQKIEIQRTYMGKLGEAVFAEFLNNKNIRIDTRGMFDIYEGQQNVDSFDFITANGKTIDIKTGFRNIHKRLLVNIEQFDNLHKDYYVAVKIDTNDVDSKAKLVDWNNISMAHVLGYAEYAYMQQNARISNFGEGDARFLYYNNLLGIDSLLRMF